MTTLPHFSAFAVQGNQMFFMLETIESDDFVLIRRTPAGDERFHEFTAYRTDNNLILLAFPDYFRHASKGNLVAIANNQEEIVNLQVYERLREHYDLGTAMPTDDKGVFCFLDSLPIHNPLDEWRCDTTSYGPLKYLAPNEDRRILLSDGSQLKTYEPVFCVNGVAHLVYIHRQGARVVSADSAINESEVPFIGVTLSEVMKLIDEWATVAEAPFRSDEEIALDARDFLRAIDFSSDLVANQVDAQVARYLKGDSDARRRSFGPQDNTDDLRFFLKRRVSFLSLAGILSVYSGAGSLAQAVEFDLMSIESDYASTLARFEVDPREHSLDNYQKGIDAIDDNRLIGARQFMRLKSKVLLQKREIAILLRNNPSADI